MRATQVRHLRVQKIALESKSDSLMECRFQLGGPHEFTLRPRCARAGVAGH